MEFESFCTLLEAGPCAHDHQMTGVVLCLLILLCSLEEYIGRLRRLTFQKCGPNLNKQAFSHQFYYAMPRPGIMVRPDIRAAEGAGGRYPAENVVNFLSSRYWTN